MRKISLSLNAAAAAAVLTLFAGSAFAHHSYIMFDRDRKITVDGTIAKLEWQNPHVWVWAYVANDKGGFDLWGFESGSVNALARRGWRQGFLKTGEKMKIELYPLKNGEHGGYFIKGTRPDGSVIESDEPIGLQAGQS